MQNQILNLVIIFAAKYLYLIGLLVFLIFLTKQEKAKQKELLIFALFALPFIYILSRLAGSLYYDPRPFIENGIAPLIAHAPDNGFPSDHALLAFSLAALVFPYNRKMSYWLWLIAILTGISRVYAGVHHFTDIVGSLLIAILGCVLIYKFALPKMKLFVS